MPTNAQEIWKDIPGYESRYMVSNFGRIRSLPKCSRCGIRLMHPGVTPGGYLQVTLRDGKRSKLKRVHRLVAIAFLPNPRNLPAVNHIDENKLNNFATNLEWCTAKDNDNHGTRNYRMGISLRNNWRSRAVYQIDSGGKIIATYPSAREAERVTGFRRANICKSLRFSTKKCGGYFWRYVSSVIPTKPQVERGRKI